VTITIKIEKNQLLR